MITIAQVQAALPDFVVKETAERRGIRAIKMVDAAGAESSTDLAQRVATALELRANQVEIHSALSRDRLRRQRLCYDLVCDY